MDLALSGLTVIQLMTLGILLSLLVIVIVRLRFKKEAASNLSEHQSENGFKLLADRVKYPEVNIFRSTKTVLGYGMACSLAFVLLAFSWTSYESEVYIPDGAFELDEEIEIEPPRTADPPPPLPPPPPPVIEEVPEEEIDEEDEPEFVDQDIEEESIMEEPEPEPIKEKAPVAPPPPMPEPEEEIAEIFKVVEQMPRFPGCEDVGGTEKEKADCAMMKMMKYVYKNLKYPAIARENGIEGRVTLQFVVDQQGKVVNAHVVRGIGAGCDKAALKVVNAMNQLPQRWTPGMQRGKPVKVLYTLPVTFELQN